MKTKKTPAPVTRPSLAELVRYGRSRKPAYVIYQSDVEEFTRRLSADVMSNLLSGLGCVDACSNALFSLGIALPTFEFKVPRELVTRIEITGKTKINTKLTKERLKEIATLIHKVKHRPFAA